MQLRRLLLVAASPLCLTVTGAHAETAISTAVTTPLATATAAGGSADDLRVTASGSVKPAGGTAVTLNSDNKVTVEGAIAIQDANAATGIAVQGGRTGEVKLTGSIALDESTVLKDTDGDGDLDGPFATGSGRFGIRATGAQAFHGSILSTGTITIEGNDSAAISLEAPVDGSVKSGGAVSVSGDRSYGLHAAKSVGGDVSVTAGIAVQGKDAVGVALDDTVGGRLLIDAAVSATGFRYTARPADAAVAKLDADDLLTGGPAVRIAGDVKGGVLIDAPPADLDPKDPDEDKDGVPDAQELTGTVVAYGSAAALRIGSDSRAVTIGAPAGIDAAGLEVRGVVQGQGVYDGYAATAVQLGGLGQAVTVQGGVRVTGQVLASAAKADATALRLGAGAQTPGLTNSGSIKAQSVSPDAVTVQAVRLEAGASLPAITNSGTVSAAVSGGKGNATAIFDGSGSLRTLTNTNLISATVTPTDAAAATGRAIALDLRANTAGVTVRQTANASASITPTITGDVLFGSGAARLELMAGQLNGSVAFGSGADALVLDGGARLTGAITDAGGGLTVDIVKGRLTATNLQTVTLTSLTLGAAGELVMTVDPVALTSTRFDVAGAANIAAGAKLGLRLTSKLTEARSFTLIKAGALTAGALDQSLLGSTPWLYQATLRVDQPQNAVIADVRRRTAKEAGLNSAEASAYEAVFANFDRDAGVRDALLGKTDGAAFAKLYDQFLPDHSGGLFQVMAAGAQAAGRAADHDAPRLLGDGLRGWTQEIAFIVRRDLDRASSYDGTGFGVAGGVETPPTELGVLGLQTSFLGVNVDEKGSAAAESLDGSLAQIGVYWRGDSDGLSAALAVNGGYAWMKSARSVSDAASGLSRLAKSDWRGKTLAVHADLGWRLDAGRLYARPEVTADYFLLKEDGRQEHGGGAAVDLKVEDRTGQQLGAFAGVTVGGRWGVESAFAWSPELTLGWRQVSGDGAGVTTARFVAGGPAFQIAAPDLSGGGAVARIALHAQGEYVDLLMEAGGEVRDGYETYDARIAARLVF
ncbi:autotransporter outer membrane beta-barrel domain-containing protein [Phenylobacterium aquaticum]|uniref:autotransporter family protein n=1 Tax=Phenylobacterium aquaticum TaxID=1763816 RepID=UPI0026EE84D7|nr:autotransporter outer membrane beta-barrel domain-containing protein [Phenylobacterium aquaticum]